MPRRLLFLALAHTLPVTLFAQPAPERHVPPKGVVIPETDRQELTRGVEALGKRIEALRSNKKAAALLPDVIIFHKAVDWALRYDEFMNAKHVQVAKDLLAEGAKRASELEAGKPSWPHATGPVVRGYQSRIDGSIQPYGLVVPADWTPDQKSPRRLDIWQHGRGNANTELPFIAGRMKGNDTFTLERGFMLHPYGRFCNATKFAGETDTFEAIEHVRANYPIDDDRTVLRGFSMGGASAWHQGVHFAGRWAAINPGAGFSETAEYAGVFKPGKPFVPWWEQVLWRLYDADIKVLNLSNTRTVAYSGEVDGQRAAAEKMVATAAKAGVTLDHYIGPKTGHKYEPETKKVVAAKIEEYVDKGRDLLSPRVRFVLYTLRYNTMKWVEVDALEKHWERAEVDAQIVDESTIKVSTRNVSGLTFRMEGDKLPLDKNRAPRVIIDGTELTGPAVAKSWVAHFSKTKDGWSVASEPGGARSKDGTPSFRKRHGLTGPIDDAFFDRFIFVRPTGKALNPRIEEWSKAELDRAITEWRRVFRGDAIVKNDTEVTAEDIGNAHLVLWGDPASNALLGKVLPKLPLEWSKEKVALGQYNLDAAHYAPVLIHPNPLNPERYVVLNSSFTFRMGSRTSNSLQTPKLPDWALVDLRTPADDTAPGLVYDAGFFNEYWQP